MFCEKCGSLTVPSSGKMVCLSCGHETSESIKLGEKAKASKKMLEAGEYDVNPIVPANCRKCKNKEAYYAIKQTRSSDEAPTKFFRCTKCGFTWRQYD